MAKKHKRPATVGWLERPEEHDFLAAADYLSLLLPESACDSVVAALRDAPVGRRKAKDLLRASRLELLADTDGEVRKDLEKVAKGDPLSPVLLVRGAGAVGAPLIVADGYHRVCATYHVDEGAEVACCLVDVS